MSLDDTLTALGVKVSPNQRLDRLVYWRVGGPAERLLDIGTVAQLQGVMALGEPVTVLDARQILPQSMLEGPNFWIDPEVRNDGLVNTYRVKTEYGTLEIEGSPLLFERIGELRGLAQIEKLEKSEVYQSALKAGAT